MHRSYEIESLGKLFFALKDVIPFDLYIIINLSLVKYKTRKREAGSSEDSKISSSIPPGPPVERICSKYEAL
jgi:hypothetical protein